VDDLHSSSIMRWNVKFTPRSCPSMKLDIDMFLYRKSVCREFLRTQTDGRTVPTSRMFPMHHGQMNKVDIPKGDLSSSFHDSTSWAAVAVAATVG